MDRRLSGIIFGILPGIYLILAFLYIFFITRPEFYFHHVQPPFILSIDYLVPYLKVPGGLSEMIANLFMQSFCYRVPGTIVLFGLAGFIGWLALELMNLIRTSRLNRIWALIPFSLTIILTNHYNFPFSVIVSLLIVLTCSLLLAKKGKRPAGILILYTFGSLMVYYSSGSGYMILFSLMAWFFTFRFNLWKSLLIALFIAGFTFFFCRVASATLFPIPQEHTFFYFFPGKIYFMTFEPNVIFYIYLLSVPGLLLLAFIMTGIQREKRTDSSKKVIMMAGKAFAVATLLALTFSGHRATCRGDAGKIVAVDYYCYHNDTARTAKVARSLDNYSLTANLNYNLAISKAGTMTEDFFKFLQLAGTDALHPDAEFDPEKSFIAADFYYNLGYITEARHWAYASLVDFPYSPRALRILVKIHLITGEYNAARRCLIILSKGLTNRKFVREFSPYLQDTSMIETCREIMEKRNFIPAEKELTPFIDVRFRELLEANARNKFAYEHLVLYYLLDAQLERFMELYEDADNYFSEPVDIYEEAILMFGEVNDSPVNQPYQISPGTMARYREFNSILEQYEGDEKMARNVLYWKMGTGYLYYFHFIYPRIVKPVIIYPEDEEPPI
ncbi:MAG: hypothetical protein JXR52_01600 [Bacteroidales bacterium]|nr:hypothetical protein [Bacteroidales bacterium]